YCGSSLSRRSWHGGTQYNKIIWHCVTSTKKGKKYCPESKGIPEETIEQAFLESYRMMCNDNQDVLEEFLQRMEEGLGSNTIFKEVSKIEKEIEGLETKKSNLIDMRVEDTLDTKTYEDKYNDIIQKIDHRKKKKSNLKASLKEENVIKGRLLGFRKLLEQEKGLNTFDRHVFESIIENGIIGGVDKAGNDTPFKITFIYKTGVSNSLDGNHFKPPRRNAKDKKKETSNVLCSNTINEVNNLYPNNTYDTCGKCSVVGV